LKKITLAATVVATVLLTLALQTRTAYSLIIMIEPQGTEITESGIYTGTLSDAGSLTWIDEMGYDYFEMAWFWVELGRFDMLHLKLEMDSTVDLDLGAWRFPEGAPVEKDIMEAPGLTEEVCFINYYETIYQIFIGCYSGSGDYSLTVEIERTQEITGSGIETGSLQPGDSIDRYNYYRVELQEGETPPLPLIHLQQQTSGWMCSAKNGLKAYQIMMNTGGPTNKGWGDGDR